jgi:hypothetical protein
MIEEEQFSAPHLYKITKISGDPLVMVENGKELLRLSQDGKLTIDPQNTDEAALKFVDLVQSFCLKSASEHPFKDLYVKDLEAKLAELQSDEPSIIETHRAKNRMLKGYALYYPEHDPRLSLLGVEYNGDYKVEAYGNTLIKTKSIRSWLWGVYAVGVTMGIVMGIMI